MATTTITQRCRVRWLSGNVFNMSTDTIKMALYNGSAHNASTNVYTVTSEAAGTGYTAGGVTMAGISQNLDSGQSVVYLDWSTDPSWAASTITATDCMIYNSTASNDTMYIGDFAGSKSSSNGLFQVVLPAPGYNTAVIRIA